MTFLQAIKSFFRNFLNFKGRASRSEYWWVQLFNFPLSILVSIISVMDESLITISYVYSIVLFLPFLSLTFRRIHDIGHSFLWFILKTIIFSVVSTLVLLIIAVVSKSVPLVIVALLVIVLSCIAEFIFGIFAKKGTHGPNAYGEDPLLNRKHLYSHNTTNNTATTWECPICYTKNPQAVTICQSCGFHY